MVELEVNSYLVCFVNKERGARRRRTIARGGPHREKVLGQVCRRSRVSLSSGEAERRMENGCGKASPRFGQASNEPRIK